MREWVRAVGVGVAVVLGLVWLPTDATGVAAAAPLGAPVLRVMPLGDSITWGVGSATTSSYRAPLWNLVAGQSRYAVRFVGSQASGTLPDPSNEGHSGYIIQQIRDGVDGWLAGARPDVVLLHIGVNDLNRGIDTAHAPDRFADLIDRVFADRPGITVLAMGVIPTSPGLESAAAAYNASIKALAGPEQQAGKKFRYVEPPALTSAEMVDHLHPNDAGYLRMANAFSPALDQAFTDRWVTGGRALGAGTESGTTGAVRWGDFDGDGRADYLTVASSGAVSVWLNRGGDGHGGWQPYGQVATGQTTDGSRVRFADFDGDGRTDYLLIGPSGAVSVWLNRGGDGHGGWQALGQIATGLTSDATHVRFADFDGDGRTDYVLIGANGALSVWLNHGGDGHGGWQAIGQTATGTTTDATRVRFADLDADGRADYSVIQANGSVQSYLNRGGDGGGGWVEYGQAATGLTADASRVSFADFTGDGNADYILLDPTDNAATVYAWNGGDGHGGWIGLGQVASGVPVG
ncbi:MAG TPA: FG-GAP-like repeat-containing protein [Streptomyces sp.]